MYTRVYSKRDIPREKISIPDNYSGNAFNTVNNEITENESENTFELYKEDTENEALKQESTLPSLRKEENIISSLIPKYDLKNHFPFGHGIGSEELLILGIMSILFMPNGEREPDGELIMLLALLLFAG